MVTILDYVFLVALFMVGVGICGGVWMYQRKHHPSRIENTTSKCDGQSEQ